MKYVIIGGVAAGMSAASKIARAANGADITVFEAGSHVSYGACGLPYYISGDNPDESLLFIRTVEDFRKQGINVQLRHQAVKVETTDKKIMVRSLDTGNLSIVPYDKLMIATGASAIRPELAGVNLLGVHTLKTVLDANAIKTAAEKAKTVVIAGGGYIGVELAEAMIKIGKRVTLIEGEERILSGFSPELSEMAQKELERCGAVVRTGERLAAIQGDTSVAAAVTSCSSYPCDLLILSLGLRPNTAFLKGSGIKLAVNGAVEVDREQRTSCTDVFAAGDCALTYNSVSQKNAYIPLGTVANKCGRLAGGNMAGECERFEGALGSAAIKVMDLEFAKTGLSAREASVLNINFGEAAVTAASGPKYYPDQTPILMKVLFNRETGCILGGCAGGKKGAVLRIDALAAAITGKMTLKQLGQADFCYAPPFSEVWDVLNIAANYAESKRNSYEK